MAGFEKKWRAINEELQVAGQLYSGSHDVSISSYYSSPLWDQNIKGRGQTFANFEKAEVLICNFGQWQDKPDVIWCMPDLYHKDYSEVYEVIGKLPVAIIYDSQNYEGKGYLFKPTYTAGWRMNESTEKQFESEMTKNRPTQTLTIRQLTIKPKRWKIS